MRFKFLQRNYHSIFKKEDNDFCSHKQCYVIIIALHKFVYWLELTQVSDVAHGPLVVMNVSHFRPDQHKIPDEVLTVCCEVSTGL